jgi:hypothetical protein
MARILQSGFELNSNTVGIEFDGRSGSPTIQTGTVRSGTYAMQVTGLTSATARGFISSFVSAANNGPFLS